MDIDLQVGGALAAFLDHQFDDAVDVDPRLVTGGAFAVQMSSTVRTMSARCASALRSSASRCVVRTSPVGDTFASGRCSHQQRIDPGSAA
jgi:hypothetical protein